MSGVASHSGARDLPWLSPLWARLQASRAADRLAHGLLLTGPRGLGKRLLIDAFAHSLLCRAPDAEGHACGQCADCRLIAAASHPDLIRVGPDPEAKSGDIAIAAIRELSEREVLSPSRAPWKVIIIDPADHLNAAAANALLKTLEEPVSRTLMCLIAEQPGRLPATIRSRCQHLRLEIPAEDVAVHWLQERMPHEEILVRLRLAHGAPLRALDECDAALLAKRRSLIQGFLALARGEQDPIRVAATWNETGASLLLEWLAGWLCDLLRWQVSAAPGRVENPDFGDDFRQLAGRVNPVSGHRLLRQVLEARGLAQTTVNPQLLLESLAIDWVRVARHSQVREVIGR